MSVKLFFELKHLKFKKGSMKIASDISITCYQNKSKGNFDLKRYRLYSSETKTKFPSWNSKMLCIYRIRLSWNLNQCIRAITIWRIIILFWCVIKKKDLPPPPHHWCHGRCVKWAQHLAQHARRWIIKTEMVASARLQVFFPSLYSKKEKINK